MVALAPKPDVPLCCDRGVLVVADTHAVMVIADTHAVILVIAHTQDKKCVRALLLCATGVNAHLLAYITRSHPLVAGSSGMACQGRVRL